MAVINVTPDSFYDKSRATHEEAVARAFEFQTMGADLLDIGGESTRPGSAPVSEKEELERVIPVIEALQGKLSIPISIDTVKPAVAKEAAKRGATLLNDVSGFRNPEMIEVARRYDMDVCVMHMDKNPQTMQENPHYHEGIANHLLTWFQERINTLTHAGIAKEKIILDPGIGFGKTVEHNLEILYNLARFKELGYPILFGASRKTFLSKILGKPATELLAATIVVNTLAIAAGVDFIRVHDIKEHRDAIDVMTAYREKTLKHEVF